jgi:argininosuccinate lyase
VLGDLVSLLGTLKGLPSGYNKDLQDDKRALFDAVDTLELVLPAVNGTLAELQFDATRMAAALGSAMMATDLADYLVRRRVSFRTAHQIVGRLVRTSEERGVELADLSLEEFRAVHPAFEDDVREALLPRASIARREVDGGTGPEAVSRQLELARARLARKLELAGHGYP